MKPAAIKAVAAAALDRWEAVAYAIDPGFQVSGDEVVMLNPNREDRTRKSFSFNRARGVWKENAGDGAGGSDLVSLWSYTKNIPDQGRAAEDLASLLALDPSTLPEASPRKRKEAGPLLPVPDEALEAIPRFIAWAKSSRHATGEHWILRDLEGRALMLRLRVEPPGEKKDVLPFSWDFEKRQWRQGGDFNSSFYGLERLKAAPGAPVLLVEGEKTADAAALIFPSLVALAFPGTSSQRRVNLEPLQGREVILWPDADSTGIDAARTLAARLAQEGNSVRMVELPAPIMAWIKPGKSEPGGWDLADAPPEGVDLPALLEAAAVVDLGRCPVSDSDHPELPERPAVHGFEWGARGLFYLKTNLGKDEDGNPKPPDRVWIAPPFSLPGLVRNEDSRGWRLLIAWKDLDGIPHEEALPFELLSGEGSELARTLAQGGLVLPPDAAVRKQLLRYLCGAAGKVPKRVRLVETLGWTEGAFILPGGECIGTTSEPVRFAGDGASPQGAKGTLEGWQEGVARFAVGNPRLAFALASAFAGPLLDLVRPDGGGGFNLMGSSSKGKSTCLEAAASVWGRPHPLPTWRATSNGLEGIAAERNDGFLALDEISQVDPKEAGSVAYMLANGSAKARATKEGGARSMKQWRIVFLSSGEQSLEDKMSEDGKPHRVHAGQEVRVPDIPCPDSGMFEEAHGLPGLGALAEHLKAQARKNYGHPIRAFLANISQEWPRRDALVSRLKTMEADWLASAVPAGADGQVRRVAARFALVAVAGELARVMGILPWPEGEAERAALECYRAWVDRRGHIGASERERGLQAVVDFLSLHGLSRFAEWNNPEAKPVNMAGVRKASEEYGADGHSSGWDFYISPTGWKEACKGFDRQAVARAAVEDGLLEPDERKTPPTPYQKRKTPHGEGQYYMVRAQSLGMFRFQWTA